MSGFAPVTIYYWGMFGRAGAAIRMLEHANAPYVVKSEFPDVASVASAFGASSDNFAPPILIDGDEHISQSTAVCMHIGNKHGLNANILNPAKAVQYMADLIDLFELGIAGAAKGVGAEGAATFKAYLEGDRFPKILGNLERSITGPFYFGDLPTYVDFLLCAAMDWADTNYFNRISVTPFAAFPKISGVVSGIRGLDSYKNYNGGLKTSREGFDLKDDFVLAYKSL